MTSADAGPTSAPPARQRRRGVAVRPRATRREDIRQAAVSLFAERGYHGTGMEDIARAVGIRASSLYNHVASKQELLADIMITTMRELQTGFDTAVAGQPPAAALRRAMEVHVRYHGIHRLAVRIGNREIPSTLVTRFCSFDRNCLPRHRIRAGAP